MRFDALRVYRVLLGLQKLLRCKRPVSVKVSLPEDIGDLIGATISLGSDS